MRVIFQKSQAEGRVLAPPSKSVAHRFLIASALARGISEIVGISESDDMQATSDCIKTLGASVEKTGDVVKIDSRAMDLTGKQQNGTRVFDCRESGSTLRFLIPVACALFDESVFVGSERLLQRGVEEYKKTLGENGVTLCADKEKICLQGRLKSGRYALAGNVSSQYVSGLMFALPLVQGDSVITVSKPVESRAYIDLTVDVLKKTGIEIVETEENVFFVKGNQTYKCGRYVVEGDWSNAAALLAFGEIGGKTEVVGLDENSVQGDKVCKEIFKRIDEENAVVDLANSPDLAPVCFAVAACKNGATFTGTRRLKIKESDRAAVMAQELKKFGIDVDVHENDVVVHKNAIKTPDCAVCGHNDHRIVMACSLLLSKTGGSMDGAEVVRKSYPNFFEDIGELGVKYEIE